MIVMEENYRVRQIPISPMLHSIIHCKQFLNGKWRKNGADKYKGMNYYTTHMAESTHYLNFKAHVVMQCEAIYPKSEISYY